MDVKYLLLICLALLLSVNCQDETVNEDEGTVSDGADAVPDLEPAVEGDKVEDEIIDEQAPPDDNPVEIMSDNPGLRVSKGAYQLAEGEEVPVETNGVVNLEEVQNARQLLAPSPTDDTTFNEYGELYFFKDLN